MDEAARARLVANIAGSLSQVSKDEIIERSVAHFRAADAEYGERVAVAVAQLRAESVRS
jgi:catalase